MLSNKENSHSLLPPGYKAQRLPQRVSAPATFLEQEEVEPIHFGDLLRRYVPLGLCLIAMGGILGTAIVVLETPIYKSRILLEVQPVSTAVLGQGMDPFAALYSADSANLQTQVKLLESGPFRARIAEQMNKLPAPPLPPASDTFGRLRAYLRPKAVKKALSSQEATSMAADTFDVRIINETRLVELSCESPHPAIVSGFLNNIATEFIDDTVRSRSESSDKTNAWLASHIQETKSRLQDADAKLRAFVLRSGNAFASSDGTIDDIKLKQLQTELASAQTVRLSRQAQYETAVKSNFQSVPEVLQDPIASGIRTQLSELGRQRAILLTTYTPSHPKVKALDDQQRELEGALKQEASGVVSRLQNEYENALRHERLLLEAYAEAGGQVSSQASKAAEYAALRREVDGLQKMYDSLLQEMNRTEVSQSAPVIPLRLVEASVPPERAYKPRPGSEILLAMIGGLAVTVGFAFVREKLDRRLRSPESVQMLVKVPQLGVIPAADKLQSFLKGGKFLALPAASSSTLFLPLPESHVPEEDSSTVARAAWHNTVSPLADSFRATLASLNRHFGGNGESKVILVTSSTPGEGKTTVVSNLGIAFSEAGKRVVVLDADFRRPSLSKVFGLEDSSVLPSRLRETIPVAAYPLEDLVIQTSFPGLFVTPCANAGSKITTLIYSERLPQIIERLRSEFDVVLVDVPPILFPADARVIAQFTDGVILVIRAGQSEKESIRAAVNCLHEDGVPILGTVLNDWVPFGPRSGMRYYNYYYSHAGAEAD